MLDPVTVFPLPPRVPHAARSYADFSRDGRKESFFGRRRRRSGLVTRSAIGTFSAVARPKAAAGRRVSEMCCLGNGSGTSAALRQPRVGVAYWARCFRPLPAGPNERAGLRPLPPPLWRLPQPPHRVQSGRELLAGRERDEPSRRMRTVGRPANPVWAESRPGLRLARTPSGHSGPAPALCFRL